MGARNVLWIVLGGVGAALVTAGLGLIGITAGASSLSTAGAVAGRTVLSLVALAFVVLLVVRRAPWTPLFGWLGMGLVAFLFNPLAWTAGAESGGASSVWPQRARLP